VAPDSVFVTSIKVPVVRSKYAESPVILVPETWFVKTAVCPVNVVYCPTSPVIVAPEMVPVALILLALIVPLWVKMPVKVTLSAVSVSICATCAYKSLISASTIMPDTTPKLSPVTVAPEMLSK